MAYIQVVAGLVLLVVAGDYLVRGSVSLARRAGVSKLIIGLTIVAFGTSAPELVVGVDAVLTGAPTLALGNVVGSNIANVLLVVGLPAIISPMVCSSPRLGRNLMFMLAATVLFIGMAFTGTFEWQQGVILLAFLSLFIGYSISRRKACPIEAAAEMAEMDELQHKPDSYRVASIMVLGGLIGLIFGADLLVVGSVDIARNFGVSEAVIGLTLVALGTSLPELITALVAAVRGHCEVAVGNVIGSNIFNLLSIIGITSIVGPIPVPDSFLNVDLWVMLASSLFLVPFIRPNSHVGKVAGIVMVLLYIGYIVYLAQSAESATAMGMTL
ncbi:MAG: calcium/sodium antiporter [Alphaproteobacteria bacterium]|nr:calcium/sodium antiporter [Alphaproteobacteria bacterium]